jgi:murein DD-endopeptidase MepM/ murein hydrolase activator NlpD
VLAGAAVAAVLAVYRNDENPGLVASADPTATSAAANSTSAATSDPNVRRSQPGFGGALPGPDASSTATATEKDASSTAFPSASVLPGSGVVTVSARESDTIVSIAEKFDVSVASLLWSNGLNDPVGPLGEGMLIRVPRVDGVIHEVQAGDTLRGIAERYGVEADQISGYQQNDLDDGAELEAGTLLLVPGGRLADRGSLDEFTVREGDTLTDIASYFGLQPQTLVWANELPDPTLIHVSQVLLIPPGDGALVTVAEGDTVELIAERFSVDPDELYDYGFNGLDGDGVLQAGQHILVPGDFLPDLPDSSGPQATTAAGEDVAGPATGTFIWPVEGWVSQEFHTGHPGVDIANEAWTPVNAMDGGVVIFAGWNDYGLGYAVGIDHGNGFQTWYGHFAAQPYVEVGQIIWQGGYLGPMGSTGRSSGPHLHLVVLKDGVYLNPLDFLQ